MMKRLTAPRALAVAAAIGASAVASRAEAQPLPQGNAGIAARYAEDKGIAGDADVIFADDFEGVTANKLPTSANWNNVYGNVKVVQSAALAHAGQRAVEIEHLEAERSHGAWRDFQTAGFDTLFVRYYMKFDAAFPGVHHAGMAIFGGAPGVTMGSSTGQKPNGSNHFNVMLDNIDPAHGWSPAGNAPPGFQYVYCYHMDQADVWGDVFRPDGSISPNQRSFSGPAFTARPNTIPARGTWIAFELMVQLNTPGQSNGRIAYWLDGVLAADFPNLRFRSVSSLKANFVVLSSYASSNRPNQKLWYDDVVVARSYIGPRVVAASGGGPPPTPGSDGGRGSGGSSGSGPGPATDAGGNFAGPGGAPGTGADAGVTSSPRGPGGAASPERGDAIVADGDEAATEGCSLAGRKRGHGLAATALASALVALAVRRQRGARRDASARRT